MRCTRCDRPCVPQSLARDLQGRLVFGWCRACIAEAGCTLLDGPTLPLTSPRPPLRRRLRTLRRSWRRSGGLNSPGGRRLALIGLAAGLAAWSLVLAIVGVIRWCSPQPPPLAVGPSPLGNGTAPFLLAGAGLMAVAALTTWSVALPPARRSAVLHTLAVPMLAGMLVAVSLLSSDGWLIPPPLVLGPLAFGLAYLLGRRSRRRPGGPPSIDRPTILRDS